MIFNDFFKSIAQLGDRQFRRVLMLGLALSIAVLIAVYAGFLGLLNILVPGGITLPITGPISWLGDLLSFGSILLMIVLSMFLMIPVASAITSLFLDDIAQAVEDRHYSHLPVPPRVSFAKGLADTLIFGVILIVANGLAFVLYSLLPIATPFLFYGLNGYLIGREYFQIVAMRREGRQGANALRKKHMPEIWMAGMLMVLPLTIPLINLFIPVLGAATFTHLYHRLADHR